MLDAQRIGTAYDWTKKSLDGTRWRQHFFAFGHCGVLVPSPAANGLIVMAPSCVNYLYPSAEESWEEMTEIEPETKCCNHLVLTRDLVVRSSWWPKEGEISKWFVSFSPSLHHYLEWSWLQMLVAKEKRLICVRSCDYLSGSGNVLPKFVPISFAGVCRFWLKIFAVFQDTWHSNKEILAYAGVLPRLVPWWPQICKFVSHSDLVLVADHSLGTC